MDLYVFVWNYKITKINIQILHLCAFYFPEKWNIVYCVKIVWNVYLCIDKTIQNT